MKKAAVICTLVLVVGLIFAGIGFALGGVKGFDKLSEKHSWIRTSPGDRVIRDWTVDDYDSIEVTGNADIYLVTDDYYTSQIWQDDHKLLSPTEMDNIGKNKIAVIAGEKVPEPEVAVEGGVLKIKAKTKKQSGISLNFSDLNWVPKILICCRKTALNSVSISVDTGDVVLSGISYKKASLETDTGDIVMKKVTGAGQQIRIDTGDVALEGMFTGTTDIKGDTGDILVKTAAALNDLNMDLKTDTGDIVVSENGSVVAEADSVPASFSRDGGKHSLTVHNDTGDITVSCSDQ